MTLKGHTGWVLGVAFSPDGRSHRIGQLRWNCEVWDAGSGLEALTLRGHTDIVKGVAYSPDGQRIASASFDGTVKVWDAESGQEALTSRDMTSSSEMWPSAPTGTALHPLASTGR